jgi:hypothetical protein
VTVHFFLSLIFNVLTNFLYLFQGPVLTFSTFFRAFLARTYTKFSGPYTIFQDPTCRWCHLLCPSGPSFQGSFVIVLAFLSHGHGFSLLIN